VTLVTVVPAKSFVRAKSRLSPCLAAPARARLARSMLEHVLGVLRAHPLGEVVVATDCDTVAALAREHGARIAFDSGPSRLGAIVDKSLELFGGSAERALVLMSDLPELGAEDLRALLEAGESADVVLAPDLRGRCTNALLTPLPHLPTRFGHDDSLLLHTLDAEALGLQVSLCRRRGLGLDVDEPADLELLHAPQALPGRFGPA
jgi:2-phospho-L-lactate/phosphoenolpyruvate guanylyltransferase